MLCRNIYRKSCNWFMFDSTTNECKLFAGSLNDLKTVCREFGYQREPNYETCDAVFEPESAKGCYVNRKIDLFISVLYLKILNRYIFNSNFHSLQFSILISELSTRILPFRV